MTRRRHRGATTPGVWPPPRPRDIGVSTQKVEDLTSAIATDEADLKAATGVRGKEAADFAAAESELVDGVNFLAKAIGYLEREREKGNLGLAQIAKIDTPSLGKMTGAISTVMSAAGNDR